MIYFCWKTDLPIYIRIVEAAEALADTVDTVEGEVQPNPAPMLTAIRNVAERAEVALSPLSMKELTFGESTDQGSLNGGGAWEMEPNYGLSP